jgi:hypothetical protein
VLFLHGYGRYGTSMAWLKRAASQDGYRPPDGKVRVAATHVNGETEHITLPVTHTFMVYDRRVIAKTLAFLERGVFGGQGV